MKFGPVPVATAKGAILAHSLPAGKRRIRKGRTLSGDDIAALTAAGHETVVVARLDETDVPEDTAASAVAAALVPDEADAGLHLAQAHTGRVNIYADGVGVLEVGVAAVNALNRIDPMITLATLAPWQVVPRAARRQLVGTVKIISYAVRRDSLDHVLAIAKDALRLRRVELSSARLIVTRHSDTDKDIGHLAVSKRLTALGMTCDVVRVAHSEVAIADAMDEADADLILILTASATSDALDVAPQAVRRAGGRITRFGMPVDPGNLLFLGAHAGRPVIGLPGCARSPALNGADWVLERVVCGVDVSDEDIAAMGVGGLLKESPARPHPREQD